MVYPKRKHRWRIWCSPACVSSLHAGPSPSSLYHSNFSLCYSQHKALALFSFLFLHLCVCVCGGGWPCCMTFGILVLWPRIEPGLMAVKALRPNHWTAKQFPEYSFCFYLWVHLQLPWVSAAAHRVSIVAVRGLLSSCGVRASRCRHFSGGGVQAPGMQAPVTAARGPSCSAACEQLVGDSFSDSSFLMTLTVLRSIHWLGVL